MKITWHGNTGVIAGSGIEVDREEDGYVAYLMPLNEEIGEIKLPPGGRLSDEEIAERALAFAVSAALEDP
jgi:hypothetical protein